MKYVVIIFHSDGDHAFAPAGGAWIDPDTAKAWAEQYVSEHEDSDHYSVLVLEHAV